MKSTTANPMKYNSLNSPLTFEPASAGSFFVFLGLHLFISSIYRHFFGGAFFLYLDTETVYAHNLGGQNKMASHFGWKERGE